jgi:uncharacterized protein GlcG (DUF336 family)
MHEITLDIAQKIVTTALAKGRELGLAPLTVVVLDAGGHMVALAREDRSGIARVEIAVGKAWGALSMGAGSRALFNRLATGGTGFVAALAAVTDGRMVPAPGGVLIANPDGKILGAVGISGAKADDDELCGITGIQAVGLVPKPG